jgi:hypothetical protein
VSPTSDALRQRADDAIRAARARLAALPRPTTSTPPKPPTIALPTLPSPPTVTLPTVPSMTLPTPPTLPPDLRAHLDEARARRTARRNRVVAVVVAMLVLLWLMRRCDDEPSAPVVIAEAPVCPAVPECPTGPVKPKPKPKPKPSTKAPRHDVTVAQPRDLFAVPQLRTPPWLTALRLQVSARSLVLARCFTGAERPGAMRLSASVTPSSGQLADVILESFAGAPPLTEAQRQCATATLTQPPYRLPIEGEREVDIATRVSLVLEF